MPQLFLTLLRMRDTLVTGDVQAVTGVACSLTYGGSVIILCGLDAPYLMTIHSQLSA